MEKKGVAVVAVGGNSLIKNEKQKTIPDQYDAAVESIGHIVDMIEARMGSGHHPRQWTAGWFYSPPLGTLEP